MAISASELQKNKICNGDISNFFDCLTDLLLKYSNGDLIHAENFRKYFSPYMVCRYISMKEKLLPYAEYLNQVQTILTYEQFYQLAYKLIPKQHNGYIKYLKKTKQIDQEETPDGINSNNVNILLFDL